MKWLFGVGKPRQPRFKDIVVWLNGASSNSQIDQVREHHRGTREGLFAAIGDHMYPVSSEHEGEVAVLLVHLCSGRGALPHAMRAFSSIMPDELAEARRVFQGFDWDKAPPVFLMIAGIAASGEIINEALEQHYEWAMLLANENAARFSKTFVAPEILRVRGILHIVLGDYSKAISDLEEAQRLRTELETKSGRHSPPMSGLTEPLEAARKLVGASGESKS